MLIPSSRHTPADLELWAELESADRIHARLANVDAKAERAIDTIRDFAARGPCYASTSWGKDSTVLAWLVTQANARHGLDIPLVWLTYGRATNPGCCLVRDAFHAAHGDGTRYLEIDVGESEVMRDDFRPAVEATGTDRYILGIRADESSGRRKSLLRLGLQTIHACRPLGWWRLPDVFAFLASHDLPVHPNYAMLGGGRWPREHIRTASIGGERAAGAGRREWEQEYHGTQLRRLGL